MKHNRRHNPIPGPSLKKLYAETPKFNRGSYSELLALKTTDERLVHRTQQGGTVLVKDGVPQTDRELPDEVVQSLSEEGKRVYAALRAEKALKEN